MDTRIMNVFSAEMEKAAAFQFVELVKEAGWWQRIFGRGAGEAAEQTVKQTVKQTNPETEILKRLTGHFPSLKGVRNVADIDPLIRAGKLGPAEDQILKRLQRQGRKQYGRANPFKDLKNVDELAEAYKANPGLQQQISGLRTGQQDLMKQLGGAQSGREAAEQSRKRWQMGALGLGTAGLAGMGAMSHMANRPQAPGAPMINYSPGRR